MEIKFGGETRSMVDIATRLDGRQMQWVVEVFGHLLYIEYCTKYWVHI